MKKITPFLLGLALLFGAGACQDVESTSADAPSGVGDSAEEPAQVGETYEDARNETRRAQLNSDIRAREERNNAGGDPLERADSDLASEVRSKLEANIPQGKLAVIAEDGVVTVTGTVPNQQEYDSIPTLAREIRGVQDVKVDAQIVAPAETAAPADQ
ncbi:BON domain-containing protein [Laspinema olomoucense]|uniref:BON domain-containing protein n=1 Tax=Laspinema olomoucense D3b TaxID=2953688 RepID=A0ABT2NFZ7_9CYAN|nr:MULTISPECIES: BON domain-containing protein [unclassified Laspinema]MCT7973870.1 BON domain-containing protein [Laspinema sp. D3d]MCT7981421.1 BON domain-containing protein [Laspinema sp. D3b]MCT7989694.1 BON domain-containing protein [Laspinema sp. D3a]MCT7996350.1 BON domain-containing protein [Laspinema sp. D3c]